jgi:hypothetical protein
MTRRRCIFTETDVRRALKGAKKAGYSVSKATINHTTGDIELVFGPPDNIVNSALDNEWDTPPARETRQ